MKISKVDHKRTAVSVNTDRIKGILYDNPAKGKDPVRDIGKQYDELSNRAEGLYSILNPAKEKEKKEVGDFRKSINRLSKELLKKCSGKDLDTMLKNQLRLLSSNSMGAYIPEEGILYDDQVERLISKYLKKSLCTNVFADGQFYYLPDILAEYLKGLKNLSRDDDSEKFSGLVRSIGIGKLEALLRALNADYRKPKRKENTIKSIEKQAVPVKVAQRPDGFFLLPSNADHPKKKYVFQFMKAYVGASEEEKKELLIHKRKLLVRYLQSGKSGGDVSVNEMSFCGELSEDESIAPELQVSFDKIYALKLEIRDMSEEVLSLGKKKNLSVEEQKKRGMLRAKKAATEGEIKKEEALVRSKIDEILATHFRAATAGDAVTDTDRFWFDYYDKVARKILLDGHKIDGYKLSVLWLGKKIWAIWTSYIAEKYIDFGKAVYHFVLPDLADQDMTSVSFGEVLPEFRNGISSFEYERIKAKENLDRSTAVAVTSAVNTFSRAILESIPVTIDEQTGNNKEENDILFVDRVTYGPHLYKDAGKRVLRYFGGFSSWVEEEDVLFYAEDEKGIELVEAIKQQLSDLRNNAFHYTDTEETADAVIIKELFEHEEKQFSGIVRQKYFSNNVFRYYGQAETKALLDKLYRNPAYVPSQVPSFGRLFNRNSAYSHDKMLMGKGRQRIAGRGPEEAEIFKGTFLFLLKEIYYNAFLQDGACKDRFLKILFEEAGNIKVENTEALEDFRNRIRDMGPNVSMGEICQQIMTDYEMQNQNKKVRKSGKNDKEIYKHFRTLLYLYMREAFVDYLIHSGDSELFRFVRNPSVNENAKSMEKGDYLKGWDCSTYAGIMKDDGVLKWYTMAHFLDPKQLNHLSGALKSYEVYIKDIERRASDTGNRQKNDGVIAEAGRIREIVDILTFASNFCAKTTNNIDDYFSDEEEYAAVLSGFVDIKNKYVSEYSTALKIFCDNKAGVDVMVNGRKSKKEVRFGIYHDGTNPIPNRNVFMAAMYSDLGLLSAVSEKIKDVDVKDYYRRQAGLAEVFKRGKCISREEQESLKEFQNKKNCIELNDLLSFTEIVNDLNGQLVNWSYFRERDLMYMQLGVQYTKLFFTDAVPEGDIRRTICGEGFCIIEGAILYQIAAMYTYGLPLYGFNKEGKCRVAVKAGVSSGGCIGAFVKSYCGESFAYPKTYNEGLYFFENLGDHDHIIDTRNYIDHFKYYAGQKRSILDLYSEIYERFFFYSVNFKKSVSFILPNILERYFVILRTEMKKEYRNGHAAAIITVSGASSAKLTYKITPGEGASQEEILVPARTDRYLKTVVKLLAYKA